VQAGDIVSLVCEVGEGTVHRLWEPLLLKRNPPNGYAAKFSTPDCIAAGFLLGEAGLAAFEEEAVRDPARRALAAKVSYVIDPENEYPRNFTGHIRATLKDGSTRELRQPHLRGGAHAPLSEADILAKYRANARFGGIDPLRVEALLGSLRTIAEGGPLCLSAARP
jgi:2-methylcitrate dehydratase PrpD